MRKLILYLWILLLVSCGRGSETVDKPVISVSIIPQQFFIEQLAGDLAEINVLIPPGASPASYEPSVSQLGKLDRSLVYMRIGYVGFEQSWMEKIQSVNPEMKIVDLSEGVEIVMEEVGGEEDHHGHVHHGPDPHIWMSVNNVRVIAQNIYQELLLQFPDEKAYLRTRFDNFTLKLDSLQKDISSSLEGLENRKFMIYHPALTYYARDNALEQYPLEIEGKSPSPMHLKKMTDLANANQISKILVQSQFDRENAEILSRETGAAIILFDPLAFQWGKQMRYIATQLNPKSK